MRPTFVFTTFALLFFNVATAAHAQVRQIIRGPDQPWTYEFVVDPAPESQPGLRFQMLPEQRLRRPGNAATAYYRAFRLFQSHARPNSREEHLECVRLCSFELMHRPGGKVFDDAIATRVAPLLTSYADVFGALKIATNRTMCDWGIVPGEMDEPETTNLQIDEFQDARPLARLVQLKARFEIFHHDYEEAFRTIQIGFQLGRDVAQCPTVLTGLIGMAISIEMQVLMMEMIAQPGSPNLYWTLVAAPRPFVDPLPGLHQELNWILRNPLIREADREHTPDEWKQIVADSLVLLHKLQSGGESDVKGDSDQNTSEDAEKLIFREAGRAKQELMSFGFEKKIAGMSDAQVIVLHEALALRHKRDEVLKRIYLPYHQAIPLIRALFDAERNSIGPVRIADLKETIPLFQEMLPLSSITPALTGSIRLDRLLVRLRTIEALRLHAATHDGKLPAALSDITAVPIADDPITGGPIIYKLDGETAILEFPSPNSIASYAEITTVTVRKTK